MSCSICIRNTGLEEIKIITPLYIEDDRGYFLKYMERDVLRELGLNAEIQEEFETFSKKDVIRGLHFQEREPQTKLIRVIRGRILDVAVDLRKTSETFGRWVKAELSDENHFSLWIPAGFAHGFRVLSQDAIVSYQCVGKYLKEYDTGIRWDDKDIGIDWGIEAPIVSERDSKLQSFREYSMK